tara:strand:- start:172 stop:405 length:234 start_codon:yes stop_codon:yes gene_type:complete
MLYYTVMSKKTYEQYEETARKILGKSKITLTDYKEFKRIPYDDFSDEEKILFDWYNEGLFARIPEIVEVVGNDNFLD